MHPTRSGSISYLLSAAMFGVFALTPGTTAHAQQAGLTLDANGGIVLISKDGHRTILAQHGHCVQSFGTPDNRLMACMVSRGMDNRGFQPAYQIEIYHDDGSKFVLEPGGPIRGWHLWNDDHQIAVSFKASNGQVSDTLYSLDSGDLVESLAEPADLTQLPRWAKSQEQLNDESVPMDADSQQMRILWMDKTLRQIAAIQPGMHRRDLDTLFRMDGGINPIDQQHYRYVFKECLMIKIDVSFKAPDQTSPSSPLQQENPDDN